MLAEIDILKDVSQRLDLAGIEYMLTGSFAMIFYAQPRMTRDIDLVVELKPEHVEKVVESFSSDYYVPKESLLLITA